MKIIFISSWVILFIDRWFQLAHIDLKDSTELLKTGIVRFLPLRYSLDAEERQEAIVAEIHRRCSSWFQNCVLLGLAENLGKMLPTCYYCYPVCFWLNLVPSLSFCLNWLNIVRQKINSRQNVFIRWCFGGMQLIICNVSCFSGSLAAYSVRLWLRQYRQMAGPTMFKGPTKDGCRIF